MVVKGKQFSLPVGAPKLHGIICRSVHSVCMCAGVCSSMCKRERERERKKERLWAIYPISVQVVVCVGVRERENLRKVLY